ncbi:MAG: alpha-amylase/4-alpha-glucanotransferase domain-containing protein [Thermodesulfobacteriota bacterium]
MIYFLFCIHNHQPAGNFDFVLEKAYQDSYWPFLDALSRHPAIKLTLHNTGFLFDWIYEKHPEYIELLKQMVGRGQVEIMSGGYYEPVLSVIPEEDRLGQVRLMSHRFEEVFGARPRGIWLAERVWEPYLPNVIKRAGLEYLLVDDYHFVKAGLTRDCLGGHYITEDQANVVKIFPGNERLRYLIPFKPVEELEEYLRGLRHTLKRGSAAIYGDDGEKFGVWPGTAKWVFEDGWLERFFGVIERNLDWIKPVTFSEYVDSEKPLGRIYLPTTSYMEMGEWSLPAEASKAYMELIEEVKGRDDGGRVLRFLQGGVWRNFFSKYPESNWMHKRMLHISGLVNGLEASGAHGKRVSDARHALYTAQCNDAYWHGVFGGLYLPHLRTEVYKNLIRAQDLASGETKGMEPAIVKLDVDADGFDEIVITTEDLNLFLTPEAGGALAELDFRPAQINLLNVLTRWEEGYHYKLKASVEERESHSGTASIHDIVQVKEEGLEKYLKYDLAKRASFIERFIGPDETFESFFANTCKDLGDFSSGAYEASVGRASVSLERQGAVAGAALTLRKEIRPLGRSSFGVEYTLTRGADPLPEGTRFGVELNVILPCCDGPACFYRSVPGLPEAEGGTGLGTSGASWVERISLVDSLTGVLMTIEPSAPASLWRFPLHTVSLSEEGFEKIYQGSCLFFLTPVEFEDNTMHTGFKIKLEEVKTP